MIAALPALALLLSAQAAPPVARAQATPPRHFLGESAFSFEMQGELKQVRAQVIDPPQDWLVKVTDWENPNEDLFIAASIFEGKPGTKMDKPFLKKAVTEFVEGMEGENEEAKMVSNDAVTIDDQLAHRAAYRIGEGKEAMFIQSIFLAADTNLYSLVAVYFQESGKSADAAKKAVDSVRFKKPLPETLSLFNFN